MDARELLLKRLTEAPGLPGYEGAVREIFREELDGAGEMELDGLGSISCRKVGSSDSPRIMLAGHMDEVGWLVRSVTDDGYIKFRPLGGWWSQVMLAQRVTVYTRSGAYTGVIGSKPPHLLGDKRNQTVKIEDMYIDMGAPGEYVKEEMGVQIGDPIVPKSEFEIVGEGKIYVAKAFDNRVAVAAVIETLRALEGQDHPNAVYGVGTVQEEVGLRGARTSSWVAQPDIAFSLDVGIAGDVPGINAYEASMKMGEGPALLYYDNSIIPHLNLRDFVVGTAKEEGIPLQSDFVMGGTDGGAIHQHQRGVPTVTICVPSRHIHSHASMIHRDDFDGIVSLLAALIRRLDAQTAAGLGY